MMKTLIRNESKAGCRVWLGDGLVRFDDAGYAVGVVKRDGQPLNPPAPINETQIDHATRAAEFGYVVEEGEVQEAAVEAPEPPQDVAEPVDEAEAVDEAAEAQEAAVEATPALADEEETAPDLDGMTKGDLYKLAQDLKLDLEWTGTTSDEFREAIRAHYGLGGPAES